MPRPAESMPLGNIDEILEMTNSREPYFLFINSPSTHIPYDVPGTDVDDDHIKLIERLYREENLKIRYPQDALPFTENEIEFLKQQQIEALQWADSQLAILFSQLSNDLPTLTIVMADHGEEFGEFGRFGHVHNSDSVLFVPAWSHYSGD
jgi:membrane-anchored protein YejM (alkaline phosphatase superfamily)